MKRTSSMKRAVCFIFAVIMTFSCLMTARAGEISTYTGDTGNGKCYFSVSTNGASIQMQAVWPDGTVRNRKTSSSILTSFPIGSVITMTAADSASAEFLYWYDNATQRIFTQEKELKYILGSKVNYRAQACPATVDKIVTYVSLGGTVIKHEELSATEGLSKPATPIVPGLTFSKWSMTEQEIAKSAENSIVYPVYTVNSENYTIDITNTEYVSGEGTYPNYGTATLKAEPVNGEGESFSYWKDSKGNIVSYDKDYSFRVNYNETFTAVYGETVTAQPVIRISKTAIQKDENTITFFAERYVPEGLEIINHGILITKDASKPVTSLVLGNAGDTQYSSVLKGIGKSNENVGTYSISKAEVSKDDTVKARPYVLYLDNGAVKVLYGDAVTATLEGIN